MIDPVITDSFRLTPAVYFRIAAGAMLPILLGIATSGMLVCLVLSLIFDLRLLLVGLILLFLITPFAVGHIYFSKLLTPEAQMALTPKVIEIRPGISIIEIPISADQENRPLTPVEHRWGEITGMRQTNQYLVVQMTTSPKSPLIIPTNVFPGGAKQIHNLFAEYLQDEYAGEVHPS